MQNSIEKLKAQSLSSDLEESVRGIDELARIVIQSMNILLDSLEASGYRSIIIDRISIAIDGYIKRLDSYLDHGESGMDYWAAALLVHYGIANSKAENVLLDVVRYEPFDKAALITTILVRVRNAKVGDAIAERLKSIRPDKEELLFFQEKLALWRQTQEG